MLTQEGHAEGFNYRELSRGKDADAQLTEADSRCEVGRRGPEPGSTPLEGPLMRGGGQEGVPCHYHSGAQEGTHPELPPDRKRPC